MLIVFGVALSVRVGAVMLLPDGSNCGGCSAGIQISQHVGGDGVFYLRAGQALADGRGFVNPYAKGDQPYAQQPPLWTLVIAGTDLVALESVLAKQLLFAALGSVTAVLIGLVGRRVESDRVGVVAGIIAAIYPGFWLYERNLNAETIAFPAIALVILLAYRYRARSSGWVPALALGAAVGTLVLSRSEQALIVPLVLVPLVLFAREVAWKKRVGHLAAAMVVITLMLAPWVIYNMHRFDKPVLLSTGLGYTAQAGACYSTFYGARLGSFDESECLYNDPSVRTALLADDGSIVDETLRKSARDYTIAHRGRLPLVVTAREDRTWSLVAPGLQISMNRQLLNAPSWVLWLQLVLYWILLPFAAAGVLLLHRQRRPLYVLLAFPLTVMLSTALTFGDSRYRAPAEVTIIILAAFAIDGLMDRRKKAPRFLPIT